MLLTIIEAADLLRTTPGAARGVLDRLAVKPVNLGRGRGLGLRWYRSEIVAALDAGRAQRQKQKRVSSSPFAGKSAAQIVSELTGHGIAQ